MPPATCVIRALVARATSLLPRFLLALEEGDRPREDVARVTRVEAMLEARERDELPRAGEPAHAPLDDADRRRGVGGTGEREERQHHAVQPLQVAAERGVHVDAEVRHVADGILQPRVERHARRRLADRRRQRRAGHQQQRLAAQARAEAPDVRGVHVVAEIRMAEHRIERGRKRQRPHRLHRDERLVVEQRIERRPRSLRARGRRSAASPWNGATTTYPWLAKNFSASM